ncbi:hypothetical protein [Palleronia aestuarii]|uniref:hypothetical protein n=1 Tax=Palleronia aestuarii TaxID=568105 RepID=UPI0011B74798|nr:hypothetical protein [Palleronia aestuarii]
MNYGLFTRQGGHFALGLTLGLCFTALFFIHEAIPRLLQNAGFAGALIGGLFAVFAQLFLVFYYLHSSQQKANTEDRNTLYIVLQSATYFKQDVHDAKIRYVDMSDGLQHIHEIDRNIVTPEFLSKFQVQLSRNEWIFIFETRRINFINSTFRLEHTAKQLDFYLNEYRSVWRDLRQRSLETRSSLSRLGDTDPYESALLFEMSSLLDTIQEIIPNLELYVREFIEEGQEVMRQRFGRNISLDVT